MRKAIVFILLIIGMFFIKPPLFANSGDPTNAGRYTISGYVKDATNGESLIGATVYVTELQTGGVTNVYGFYSLSLKPGNYEVVYSFVGFVSQRQKIELKANQTINIELGIEDKSIQEVIISASRPEENVKKNEMSVAKMDMKTIKQIPALMGEVDLMKAIQLLPGVLTASEGSSAFSVRGGSPDQNLILLDEATVYNPSHLMGFFSVFNNDAIKDLKLYKGDIPPAYGGRLASLLDVRMKDGNSKKFSGTGGLGLISSRLTLEGPVFNENTSFIASGRRMYIDLFFPLSSNEDLKKTQIHFYDVNLKLNHRFNDNNRLFASGYFGRDVFKSDFAKMIFGNNTVTVRWNHLFSQKMFSNLSVIYSKYVYELGMDDGATDFVWRYNMEDIGAKLDFTWYLSPGFTFKYGIQSVFHSLDPGNFDSTGETEIHKALPRNYSIESGAYISFENDITPKLSVKYGVRYSLFQNIGTGTIYNMNEDYTVDDTSTYAANDIFNVYNHLEPRVGIKYEIDDLTSIKASYSRTAQYMQMASNSTAGTPLDLWYTASPNVKPQLSDMAAIGIFRNLFDQKLETSVEVYYKEMQNVIDFKDHASLYGNPQLEAELRFGRAKAYGTEVSLQFPSTQLSGWVSYTYSHTIRKVEHINGGREYLAPYDKPHSVNVVLNYELNKKVSFGATWVYATGAPITLPVGRAEYNGVIYPIYTDRNSFRIQDYHRLDLSITIKTRQKPGKKWQGEWNFSVYNAYGRKNPWFIQFSQDSKDPLRTYAEKYYLFTYVPSITYNFKF